MSGEDLTPTVIDLGANRRGELDESFLAMFGGAMKTVFGRMFGMNNTPITVRGNKSEIQSFANLLNKEKRYADAYTKYGLADPRVVSNKHKLETAVRKFEQATGIKYPIK